MKKIILLTIAMAMLSGSVFADSGKIFRMNPLSSAFKAKDNGGTLDAIDAYQDGVGVVVIGDNTTVINNGAMNTLVFKYGEAAKKTGVLLTDQVLLSDSAKDKMLAELIKLNQEAPVNQNGTSCNDNLPYTFNDTYQNGVCVGTKTDVNLMVVLNTSADMNTGHNGMTYLDAVKLQMKSYMADLEAKGANLSVQVIGFGTNVNQLPASGWNSNYQTQIDSLTATGLKNYDLGLATAINQWTVGTPFESQFARIDGGKTESIVLFMTGGIPSSASGTTSTLTGTVNTNAADYGIQGAEQITWNTFVNTNNIKVVAVGMSLLGPTVAAKLNPISADQVYVIDFAQLADALTTKTNSFF